MPESHFLMALVTPKPEFYNAARSAVSGILSQTRAEPGCKQFYVHDGQGTHEGTLVFYEEWTDKTALDAHYDQDYTKQVFEKYQNWLAKDVEIINLSPID